MTTEDIFDGIEELLSGMSITSPVARSPKRVYRYFPGPRYKVEPYSWVMRANCVPEMDPNYYTLVWNFGCDLYLREASAKYPDTIHEGFAWVDEILATFTAKENQGLSGRADTVRLIPDGDTIVRIDNAGDEYLAVHIMVRVSVRRQLGT